MANNKELEERLGYFRAFASNCNLDADQAEALVGLVKQELQRFADEVEKEAEALAKQLPDITPIEGLPTITQELFIDAIPLERFSAIKKKWGLV